MNNKSTLCFGLAMAFQMFTVCSLFSTTATQINWQTNYEAAAAQSKESSKPVLLFFTGSDYCGACHKLEDEVLNTPQFAQAAGDKFLFVMVDLPADQGRLDSLTRVQNPQLKQKYSINGLPTIIVVDPAHNREIGRIRGYSGGGAAFIDQLMRMVNDDAMYRQKMGALDKETLSGQELKELYVRSRKLNLHNDTSRLIKLGLASDESLFFQVERYRLFAEEGLVNTREAKALRQELQAIDPMNAKFIHYQLAVIDFEAKCALTEQQELTAEQIVAPLVSYIEKFAGKDKEHTWRLEMIISQVYLDKNDLVHALSYAQASYESAPSTARGEIAKAVNSIRSLVKAPLVQAGK